MNRDERAAVGLAMAAHAMVHTYELTIPLFLTVWLVEFATVDLGVVSFGVNAATLGLVVTAGYGLFGLGALPGGLLVDRVGSTRLIAGSLFGMGGAFLALWLAPGMASVAVALLVWGAAASVYHPAGLTLLSTAVDERGAAFAYHGMAGNAGIALGPLCAAVLLLVVGWRTVALALAVPALVAGVYAVRTDVDGGAPAVGERTAAGSLAMFRHDARRLFAGGFVLVLALVMSSGLYYRGVLTFLPEMLAELPGYGPVALSSVVPGVEGDRTLHPARYFYAALLMVGVGGQYVGGKLTDRIPVEYGLVAVFGGLAAVAAAFPLAAAAGGAPLLALGGLLGFVLFAAQPFYQATVAEYTPTDVRGLSYGFTYLGVFGVGAAGGAIAGTVLTYARRGTLFAVLAGFALVGLSLGVTLLRRREAPSAGA
ncbi:MAG: MFS transporter [Haloferacaceae archaeon]